MAGIMKCHIAIFFLHQNKIQSTSVSNNTPKSQVFMFFFSFLKITVILDNGGHIRISRGLWLFFINIRYQISCFYHNFYIFITNLKRFSPFILRVEAILKNGGHHLFQVVILIYYQSML